MLENRLVFICSFKLKWVCCCADMSELRTQAVNIVRYLHSDEEIDVQSTLCCALLLSSLADALHATMV